MLALLEIGKPAVVQRSRIGRIELDRLVVVGDRPVVVGAGRVSDSAVVVGDGLPRIGLHRRVMVGDRLGEFAARLPLDPAVGIGQRQRLAGNGARRDGTRAGGNRVVA